MPDAALADMQTCAEDRSAAGEKCAAAPLVVIAEDDPAFRRLLASMLRNQGYEVLEAQNGLELLDLARRVAVESLGGRPSLLVTDVRMPGLSGLRALSALGQTCRQLPCIVITAFGSKETHEAARGLGAVAVFDKPFNLNDLRREAARQLGLVPSPLP